MKIKDTTQIRLHIKESHKLKESNRPNVFNNNSRETYGDLINPNSKVGNVTTHDYYKFEKGKDAVLTYMTGDEYIDRCINKIFKTNYDKVVTNSVDWDKVDKYAELMKQGTKFPTPYLDYVHTGQEGRHRALAFKQAFGKNTEMPVIEVYPTNVTNDEIYDYCERRWKNGDMWFGYVASGLGRSAKEINDYLGIEEQKPDPEDIEDSEDYIEPDDLDDIDDLIVGELESELDDYDTTLFELSKKSGISTDKIENMSAFELTQLLNRYM